MAGQCVNPATRVNPGGPVVVNRSGFRDTPSLALTGAPGQDLRRDYPAAPRASDWWCIPCTMQINSASPLVNPQATTKSLIPAPFLTIEMA